MIEEVSKSYSHKSMQTPALLVLRRDPILEKEDIEARDITIRSMFAQILNAVPHHDTATTNDYYLYKDTYGKPWLVRMPDLEIVSVSISHTQTFLFVGISMSSSLDIGVDVEKIRDYKEELMESLYTEKERLLFGSYSQDAVAMLITKAWCIKESVVKALGCGFRIHPKRIDVSEVTQLSAGGVGSVFIDEKKIQVSLCHFEIQGDHVFVGCLLQNATEIQESLGFSL